MCWYSLHAGSRGAWPRVELVDEQTGKLVLGHKGKSLLKVLHRRERESGSEGGREGGVEEGKECPNVCVRVHVCLCIPYLWCFSGEATDNICCYGDTRDTAVERVCTCIRVNTTTGVKHRNILFKCVSTPTSTKVGVSTGALGPCWWFSMSISYIDIATRRPAVYYDARYPQHSFLKHLAHTERQTYQTLGRSLGASLLSLLSTQGHSFYEPATHPYICHVRYTNCFLRKSTTRLKSATVYSLFMSASTVSDPHWTGRWRKE